MKYCPRCNRRYEDEELNFCLNDGDLLLDYDTSDAPPTLYMDPPRQTNENWTEFETNQQQFGQPMATQQQHQVYQPPHTNPALSTGTENTLPVFSLILGISSFVFLCCWLGIPLGASAVIVGYLGLNKTRLDPQRYTGRELAIIGMIMGGLSFAVTLIWIFILIVGSISNP